MRAGRVLVTGFGPFPGVPENPSGRVARAVHGARVGGVDVTGIELPVDYDEGPRRAVAAAREIGASLVLGLGVATGRAGLWVEREAHLVADGAADVAGATRTGLRGAPVVRASLDPDRLARALGARLSDDAGQYVCNAWLYQVASSLEVPVGFLHVPLEGVAPHTLLGGLRALLAG